MRLAVLGFLVFLFLGSSAWADEAPRAEDVRRVCERLTTTTGFSFWSQFRDPQDGALDVSEWLASKTGFLPVPIIITEPAVGLGGGFRYLLARALGLRMGMDIARGPEDWAFYISVGSGWLRL